MENDHDGARFNAAVLKSVRADGCTSVSAADVEETRQDLSAGREPNGIIGRAIARHLRLLEKSGG